MASWDLNVRGLWVAIPLAAACGPESSSSATDGSGSGASNGTSTVEPGPTVGSSGSDADCRDDAAKPGEFCFEEYEIAEITTIQELLAGDLDGDGTPELIVRHLVDLRPQVVVVDFSGEMYAISSPMSPTGAYMMVGSFHEAGDNELAMLDPSGGGPPLSFVTYEAGVLSEPNSEPLEGELAVAGAPVDVDDDGSSELYLVTATMTETPARVFHHQSGSWAPDAGQYPFAGVIDRSPAAAGDFAAQSGIELVAALAGDFGLQEYDPTLHRIAIYDPTPDRMEEIFSIAAGTIPADVRVGDVDGDDRPDVVVTGSNSDVSILRGLGDGMLSEAVVLEVGTNNRPRVVLANLDGDPALELAFSSGSLGIIDDPLGSGVQDPLLASSSSVLAAADFNGDGVGDIACAPGSDTPLLIYMSAP